MRQLPGGHFVVCVWGAARWRRRVEVCRDVAKRAAPGGDDRWRASGRGGTAGVATVAAGARRWKPPSVFHTTHLLQYEYRIASYILYYSEELQVIREMCGLLELFLF